MNYFITSNYLKSNKKYLKISHINNFGISYGVEVDKFNNIYIPEFSKGYIVKIDYKHKKKNILKLKKNKLQNSSIFENFFYNTKLNNFLKIFKGSFLKPHDIIINRNKMYITQMGLGYSLGKGKVDILNSERKIIKTIGLDLNNNKGMISPVMTYIDKKLNIYVTEYGANKILKFNKKGNFKDWIGKINFNDKKNTKFRRKNNFLNIKLKQPHAIKIGPDKNYYLVDSWNHRIIKFTKNGKFLGWIGKRVNKSINNNWNKNGDSVSGNELGAFNVPIDLVFYKKFIYVTDCNNHRIVKITLNGKSIGWFGESRFNSKDYWKDKNSISIPSNTTFGFCNPYGMRIKNNTIYVADKNNLRIKIIKSKKLFE